MYRLMYEDNSICVGGSSFAMARLRLWPAVLGLWAVLGFARPGQMGAADTRARRMTERLRQPLSSSEFFEVLKEVMEEPGFNQIHVGVAYDKLVGFKQARTLKSTDEACLEKLQVKAKDCILQGEVGKKKFYRLFWALAQLLDAIPSVSQLLPDMVKAYPKVTSIGPQALSENLWTLARLKDTAPEVVNFVPDLTVHVATRAPKMEDSQLKDALWAANILKDVEDVAKIMPILDGEANKRGLS